jgi:PleD family two-component response regulator
MGVATMVPGGEDRPAQLVDLADTWLYRAKAVGRNRIAGSAG